MLTKITIPKNPLQAVEKGKWMPYLIIGLTILNTGLLFRVGLSSKRAAQREPSNVFVQLPSNQTVEAKPVDKHHRETSHIQDFAHKWVSAAFSWSKGDGKTEGKIEYPAQFYDVSYAIDLSYRVGWMESIHKKYDKDFPFRNYIAGEWEAQVQILDKTKDIVVEQLEPGLWKVTVIATRLHDRGQERDFIERLNQELILKAVDFVKTEDQDQTQLAKLMRVGQEYGLQIVEIRDVKVNL
ncbi:hypothetical protein [Acaryochloris sp. CCMEE 5410]|uniref:hypothetical protein n=1 Tax=Acaryochloris sp. CCMEE 5410 TaxID=310037 RepID=UPI000248484E|nr:hypothetical protein [Acaryochloris sp. CCMEE 5410]KAI9129596.1 hypothetical protein ON05_033395 [Acaryochloris sp. CCMEE 5410]